MSELRQIKKDVPEADVEAPADDNSSEPPKTAAIAFAAASASDAISPPSGDVSYNPVFIAKVIFRKVYDLLNSSDEEEDLTSAGGIITLLKDVILGVVLGVFTISCLVFLDHRNIVHFQSAHNFRNAAFQLLNDPETIANLEESSNLKFMTLSEYEAKVNEIDSVAAKLASHAEVLEKRTAEADEKRKEVEPLRVEHQSLMQNPILELDKYCGGCTWGMKFTCDGRVEFLKNTYSTRPIQAKISAMTHASCKKA